MVPRWALNPSGAVARGRVAGFKEWGLTPKEWGFFLPVRFCLHRRTS